MLIPVVLVLIQFMHVEGSKASSQDQVPPEEGHDGQDEGAVAYEYDQNYPTCNKQLLMSFGFTGHQHPQVENLSMCSRVRNSCCLVADQKNIYDNWIINNEEDGLKQVIEARKEVYVKLIGLLLKANKRARYTADLLERKKASNCKVFAGQVLHFNIEEIGPKLIAALDSMHSFFSSTYKGVYCALCDAASARFIDFRRHRIVFKQSFCRDITAYSLHVLLYFHLNLRRYLKLVSKFLMSCSATGVYSERSLESLPEIVNKRETFNLLSNCKEHRNSDEWLEHCVGVCEAFSMFTYSDFFSPHLKKYNRYNKFMEERLVKLDREAAMAELLEAEETKKTRKLAEITGEGQGSKDEPKDEDDKEAGDSNEDESKDEDSSEEDDDEEDSDEQEDKEKKANELEAQLLEMKRLANDPTVIKSVENAIGNIQDFEATFEDEGIDLYRMGKATQITEELIKNVKNADEDGQTSGSQKTPQNSDTGDTEGAGIFQIACLILAVLMF